MARRGVRVLAKDQYLHLGKGLAEGAEEIRSGGEDLGAAGRFGRDEAQHGAEFGFHPCQRFRPIRRHETGQRQAAELLEIRGAVSGVEFKQRFIASHDTILPVHGPAMKRPGK